MINMNKPLVSVVMPTYNSGELIHQAIKSILNQTYTNFEFIIINDASTDNTLNIIKEYEKKDNRIKIINNKKNLDVEISRNKGLDIAKGKYIATMDSDDISLPQRFEKQVEFLEKNKDIFLIGTNYCQIDINNKKINNNVHVITDSNKLKNHITNGKNKICHPSIMFRNEKKIRYRPKIYYAGDYDFYLQLLSNNKKLSNLKEILLQYRVHSTQISTKKKYKQLLFARKALDFYNEKTNIGYDSYDTFNPKEIFNLNINATNNKYAISSKIFYYFHKQNFKSVKKYSIKYFKLFGYFNIISVYYIISFLPKRIINLILKFKRKFI